MARETSSTSSQYGLRRLDEIAWNAKYPNGNEDEVDIEIFITPLTEKQRQGSPMRFGGEDIRVNVPLQDEVNATITYTKGNESKIFR